MTLTKIHKINIAVFLLVVIGAIIGLYGLIYSEMLTAEIGAAVIIVGMVMFVAKWAFLREH